MADPAGHSAAEGIKLEFKIAPQMTERSERGANILSVTLWRVHLDAIDPGEAAAVLSPDELARANRLKIPQVRQRFIAGRLALRRILASQLQINPAELLFEYIAKGKPHLTGMPLHFNFSHSGGLALLAVADVPVGVDVEQQRSMSALASMEATILTPEEQYRLKQWSGDEQNRLLLHLWTCKEALVKATGEGFQAMLRYQLQWDQPSEPMTVLDQQGKVIPWIVQPLTSDTDYTAAVAVFASASAGDPMPHGKLKLRIITHVYPSELKPS